MVKKIVPVNEIKQSGFLTFSAWTHAFIDAFIAISEDLNLNFSRGTMPPDPPSFPLAPATHLKIHSMGPDHIAYV